MKKPPTRRSSGKCEPARNNSWLPCDKDGQRDIDFSLHSIELVRQAVEAFAPTLLHPGERGCGLRSHLEVLRNQASVQRHFRESVVVLERNGIQDFEEGFAVFVL